MTRETPRVPPRPLLGLVGLASGFVSASLGVGGGNVTVPALAGIWGIPLKRAIGSSLFAVATIAAAGVAVEAATAPGNLRFLDAGLLVAGSLPGAAAGAALLARLPDRPLRLLFAGFLLFSAARLVGIVRFGEGTAVRGVPAAALETGIGFVAGMSASLFGIGGGIVAVPGLAAWLGVPFHEARATSLVMIVPTAAFAAWRHQRLGTPDPRLYRPLLAAGAAGAAAGVFAANALPAAAMRAAFAGFLVLVAVRLLAWNAAAAAARAGSPPAPP